MASRIAEVLEMLKDGEWHSLDGIRRKVKLTKNQVQQISGFLREYQFITIDRTEKNIRIEEAVRKFLVQEATS